MTAAFWTVPDANGWAFRQVLGLFFLALIISFLLTKKYHISVGLCFFVTAVCGLLYAGDSTLGSEVVSSVMSLLFFSCIALALPDKYLEAVIPALIIIAAVDSAIMVYRGLTNYQPGTYWYMKAWWVLTNGSLDACFVAILMPVVWTFRKHSYAILALMFLAVVVSKSTTALLTILVIISGYLISNYGFKAIAYLIPFSASIYGIGAYAVGNKFLGDSGRFRIWKMMFGFWEQKANHFIGTGPGSFWIYSQTIQKPNWNGAPERLAVFPWMHNDWLQILFEQGYIGISCVLFLFAAMLWKSFDRPILFSIVLGFGFIGITQFPLHLFYFQLLGVGLIYNVFRVSHEPVL